jgi:hypothetical protein
MGKTVQLYSSKINREFEVQWQDASSEALAAVRSRLVAEMRLSYHREPLFYKRMSTGNIHAR